MRSTGTALSRWSTASAGTTGVLDPRQRRAPFEAGDRFVGYVGSCVDVAISNVR
jgi:hypothetical protein